ncbi:MAG TPA: hypothetical protein VIX15_19360 [Streptosporangiaceae bacterium]
MRIGAGLALIAIGAILRFAVATATTHGIAVHTIGDILMLVGVLGVVLVVAVWAPWGRSRRAVYPTEVPPERAVYRTEVPADRVVYRTEVPADEVPPPRAYRYEDDFRR